MKKEKNTSRPVTAREVLLPLGIGAALFLGMLLSGGGFSAPDSETFWRVLCDAFTVPGILLTGAGLLAVVSDRGAFDGLRFGVRKMFDQVRREEKRAQTPHTYYDFVTAKHGGSHKSPRMLLLTGGLFLLGAAVSLAVYLTL